MERWQRPSFSFEQGMTLFQAEVHAIKAYMTENLDNDFRKRNIHILSD
jgi:hypothetical protein